MNYAYSLMGESKQRELLIWRKVANAALKWSI